jgi:hypothetical protein
MNPKTKGLLARKIQKVIPVKQVIQIKGCSNCVFNQIGFCKFHSRNIERDMCVTLGDSRPADCSVGYIEVFYTVKQEAVSDDSPA